MDNLKKIYAAQAVQRHLLLQLYMEKFWNDPQARTLMPNAVLTPLANGAEQAQGGADPNAAEFLDLIHADAKMFFNEVEQRLRELG